MKTIIGIPLLVVIVVSIGVFFLKKVTKPVATTEIDLALMKEVSGPLVLDRGYEGPGNIENVKRLLQQGANPHIVTTHGSTLLMRANSDNLEMIKTLLAAGVDVNSKDHFGNTALMLHRKNPKAVALLLKAGARVNSRDAEGQDALMRASKDGLVETVRLLLDNKADVHAKDNQGLTALMFASRLSTNPILPTRRFLVSTEGHEKTVQLLLAAGADVHATDKEGQTSLFHAVQWGNEMTLVGSIVGTQFQSQEQVQVVKLLLDKGIEINHKDKSSKTVLSHASWVAQILREEQKELRQMEIELILSLKSAGAKE